MNIEEILENDIFHFLFLAVGSKLYLDAASGKLFVRSCIDLYKDDGKASLLINIFNSNYFQTF